MSADNGVYILQCRDQFRVALIYGSDTLRWDHIKREFADLKSVRLYEAFNNRKEWRVEQEALWDARRILKKYASCEYGIQYILVDKSWEIIEEEALEQAWEELEYLGTAEHNDGRWNDAIETLKNVLDKLSIIN